MLLPLALVGLVGYALYTSRRPATAGEVARVGDEVQVPLATLPAGTLPPGVPAVGSVILRVDTAGPTSVTGALVALVLQDGPPPIRQALPPPGIPLAVAVPRANIVRVTRGGRILT